MFHTSIAAANHNPTLNRTLAQHRSSSLWQVKCLAEVSLEIKCIVDSYHRSYNLKKIHSEYIESVHVLKKNTSNTGCPESTGILQCILNIWNIYINTILSSNLYYKIFVGFLERNKTGSLHLEKWVKEGHFYVSISTLIWLHTVILKDLQ